MPGHVGGADFGGFGSGRMEDADAAQADRDRAADRDRSDSIDRKQNAMAVSTPTTYSLDPATATAMFGSQLGAQLSGMDIFRSRESADRLAARLNIGQLQMMANNISNPFLRAAAMGPISIALNELGKFSARNVVNQIVAGANPVYDSAGNITGAQTDERGLIAGYDVNAGRPDDGGSKEGTFTPSQPSSTATEAPQPLTGTGSSGMSSAYSGAKGPQDSSGSGRRSLFGRKVR